MASRPHIERGQRQDQRPARMPWHAGRKRGAEGCRQRRALRDQIAAVGEPQAKIGTGRQGEHDHRATAGTAKHSHRPRGRTGAGACQSDSRSSFFCLPAAQRLRNLQDPRTSPPLRGGDTLSPAPHPTSVPDVPPPAAGQRSGNRPTQPVGLARGLFSGVRRYTGKGFRQNVNSHRLFPLRAPPSLSCTPLYTPVPPFAPGIVQTACHQKILDHVVTFPLPPTNSSGKRATGSRNR